MDKELLEQFQMLAGMMEGMATKEDLKQMENGLREEIRESETRAKIYIDDKITKRLNSLTDGYKLTHEKQYELEQRVERMEQVIAELQNKIA